MNGARALLSTLVDAGVDVCFANPGTSEMHFVAALDDVPAMRGVLCLFEGVVTGAADGYGRVAGRPAATCCTSGPASATGLANLHNARRAHTPIVNIVGDHATYHARYDAPLQSDIASIAGAVSGWYRSTRSGRRRGGGRGRRGGRGDGPTRVRRHARPARRRVVVRVVDGPVPAAARRAAHGGAGRHGRRGRQGAALGRAHGAPPRRQRAARRRVARGQPGRRRHGRRALGRDVPGQPRARRGHPGRGAARLLRRDGAGPARWRAPPDPRRHDLAGLVLRLPGQGQRPRARGLHGAHAGPPGRGRDRRARGAGRGGRRPGRWCARRHRRCGPTARPAR